MLSGQPLRDPEGHFAHARGRCAQEVRTFQSAYPHATAVLRLGQGDVQNLTSDYVAAEKFRYARMKPKETMGDYINRKMEMIALYPDCMPMEQIVSELHRSMSAAYLGKLPRHKILTISDLRKAGGQVEEQWARQEMARKLDALDARLSDTVSGVGRRPDPKPAPAPAAAVAVAVATPDRAMRGARGGIRGGNRGSQGGGRPGGFTTAVAPAGSCFYCHRSGHLARDCPVKAAEFRAANRAAGTRGSTAAAVRGPSAARAGGRGRGEQSNPVRGVPRGGVGGLSRGGTVRGTGAGSSNTAGNPQVGEEYPHRCIGCEREIFTAHPRCWECYSAFQKEVKKEDTAQVATQLRRIDEDSDPEADDDEWDVEEFVVFSDNGGEARSEKVVRGPHLDATVEGEVVRCLADTGSSLCYCNGTALAEYEAKGRPVQD